RLTGGTEYEIYPHDEYPHNYTGHVELHLNDGRVLREKQPHLRGGVKEPLSQEEIIAKFHANCAFGGMSVEHAETLLGALNTLLNDDGPSRLQALRTSFD